MGLGISSSSIVRYFLSRAAIMLNLINSTALEGQISLSFVNLTSCALDSRLEMSLATILSDSCTRKSLRLLLSANITRKI